MDLSGDEMVGDIRSLMPSGMVTFVVYDHGSLPWSANYEAMLEQLLPDKAKKRVDFNWDPCIEKIAENKFMNYLKTLWSLRKCEAGRAFVNGATRLYLEIELWWLKNLKSDNKIFFVKTDFESCY